MSYTAELAGRASGQVGGMDPQELMRQAMARFADIQKEETAKSPGILPRLGNWVSRGEYAVKDIIQAGAEAADAMQGVPGAGGRALGELGQAGKQLATFVAETATGAPLLEPILGIRVVPHVSDDAGATTADVMKSLGLGSLNRTSTMGKLIEEVAGGVALDPLTYLSFGVSGAVKASVGLIAKNARRSIMVAEGLDRVAAAKKAIDVATTVVEKGLDKSGGIRGLRNLSPGTTFDSLVNTLSSSITPEGRKWLANIVQTQKGVAGTSLSKVPTKGDPLSFIYKKMVRDGTDAWTKAADDAGVTLFRQSGVYLGIPFTKSKLGEKFIKETDRTILNSSLPWMLAKWAYNRNELFQDIVNFIPKKMDVMFGASTAARAARDVGLATGQKALDKYYRQFGSALQEAGIDQQTGELISGYMLARRVDRVGTPEAAQKLADLLQKIPAGQQPAVVSVLGKVQKGMEEMLDEISSIHDIPKSVVDELKSYGSYLPVQMMDTLQELGKRLGTTRGALGERSVLQETSGTLRAARAINELYRGSPTFQKYIGEIDDAAMRQKLAGQFQNEEQYRVLRDMRQAEITEQAMPSILGDVLRNDKDVGTALQAMGLTADDFIQQLYASAGRRGIQTPSWRQLLNEAGNGILSPRGEAVVAQLGQSMHPRASDPVGAMMKQIRDEGLSLWEERLQLQGLLGRNESLFQESVIHDSIAKRLRSVEGVLFSKEYAPLLTRGNQMLEQQLRNGSLIEDIFRINAAGMLREAKIPITDAVQQLLAQPLSKDLAELLATRVRAHARSMSNAAMIQEYRKTMFPRMLTEPYAAFETQVQKNNELLDKLRDDIDRVTNKLPQSIADFWLKSGKTTGAKLAQLDTKESGIVARYQASEVALGNKIETLRETRRKIQQHMLEERRSLRTLARQATTPEMKGSKDVVKTVTAEMQLLRNRISEARAIVKKLGENFTSAERTMLHLERKTPAKVAAAAAGATKRITGKAAEAYRTALENKYRLEQQLEQLHTQRTIDTERIYKLSGPEFQKHMATINDNLRQLENARLTINGAINTSEAALKNSSAQLNKELDRLSGIRTKVVENSPYVRDVGKRTRMIRELNNLVADGNFITDVEDYAKMGIEKWEKITGGAFTKAEKDVMRAVDPVFHDFVAAGIASLSPKWLQSITGAGKATTLAVGQAIGNVPVVGKVARGAGEILGVRPMDVGDIATAFKRGMTSGLVIPFPAFTMRNLIGGMWQLATEEATLGASLMAVPTYLLDVAKRWTLLGKAADKAFGTTRAGKIVDVLQGKLPAPGTAAAAEKIFGNGRYTRKEFLDLLKTHAGTGFHGEEDLIGIPGRLSSTVHRYRLLKGLRDLNMWRKNTIRMLAEDSELILRGTAFETALRYGLTPAAAGEAVKRAALDYGVRSATEKVIRTVIPFAAFDLRTIGEQLPRIMGQKPAMIGMFSPFLQQQQGDVPLPDWVREGVSIPLAPGATGPRTLTGLGMPFEVLSKIGSGAGMRRNIEKTVLAGMQPVLKAGYMYVTKRDPFTGREVASYDRAPTWTRSLPQSLQQAMGIVEETTPYGTIRKLDPRFYKALQLLPAQRLHATVEGLLDERKDVLDRILNTFTGVRVQAFYADRSMRTALKDYLVNMAEQHKVGQLVRFFALEPEQLGPDVDPETVRDLQILTKAYSAGYPYLKEKKK